MDHLSAVSDVQVQGDAGGLGFRPDYLKLYLKS
jgi:hypothetical protein